MQPHVLSAIGARTQSFSFSWEILVSCTHPSSLSVSKSAGRGEIVKFYLICVFFDTAIVYGKARILFYVVFQYSVPSSAFNSFLWLSPPPTKTTKTLLLFFVIFANIIPSFFLLWYFPAHIQVPITRLLTNTTHHSIYNLSDIICFVKDAETKRNQGKGTTMKDKISPSYITKIFFVIY